MNYRIYKYVLKLDDLQTIETHDIVRILTVKEQGNQMVLYAIVDTNHPKQNLSIRIHGTGHPVHQEIVDGEYTYLDTLITRGSQLVWHVFAKTSLND